MAQSHGYVITGVIALGLLALVASRQGSVDAAQTAALLVSPSSGTQTVGSTFDVDLKLTTGGQAVSGVEARITLSPNLQYVSFSSGGSVFDQDVINPSANGAQIGFSRVRFDQGYNGTSGQVIKLTLKAIADGQGTVTIDQTNTSVLDYANGANILQTVTNATFTLNVPAGPEVDVTAGTQNVANGAKITLDTVKGTAASKTFTVKNLGMGTLEVGPLMFSPSGGLTLTTTLPATTLAQNASATFTVSITGDTTGTKAYTLQFPTNDPNENPFLFTLEATVSATAACGDGTCSRRETCTTCPADCGVCLASSAASSSMSTESSLMAAAGIPAALCQEAHNILTFQPASKPLSLSIDGTSVTFGDVPDTEWYAKYVRFALNGKIASGYRDAQGRLTGQFGPGNNVTHGEVTKMLLLSQGLGEVNSTPRNASARGQWFEHFFTTAEQQGWRLHAAGTLNGNAFATRGEVARAIVDAFRLSPKPKMISFTDMEDTHPYAADIYTLAGYGIMAGDPTGTVRPDAPINRAEFSKLVSVATNVGCR